MIHHIHLPSDPRSVKAARDEVAGLLLAAGWGGPAVENARVITSELATNAVLHARSPFEITVRIEDAAWIEVRDEEEDVVPEATDRATLQVGGMGLHLVEALSQRWGVSLADGGKIVWAQLERGTDGSGPGSPA